MGQESGLTRIGEERSLGEIRADIEQARAEMGNTVTALKERLSPDRLKREIIEKIRTATVGRARKMMEKSSEMAREVGCAVAERAQRNPVTKIIVDNPIPALLAGAGIASIVWWARRRSGARAQAGEWATGGERATMVQEAGEAAMGSAAGTARETAAQVGERAEQAFGKAREKAGEIFEKAKGKAGELGTATRERARALKERSQGALQEKPFLIAAAALGAGLVIGLALPGTERERRWLAKLKDLVMSRTDGAPGGTLGQATQTPGGRPRPPGSAGDLNL